MVMTPTFPIDDAVLFAELFTPTALEEIFVEHFSTTTSKGVDRLNGFQFKRNSKVALQAASIKCLNGSFRFAPYLEVLKTKGREKHPRLIGIPVIRDRIIFNQLNKFLAAIYPERVPKNVAATYVREISADLLSNGGPDTWVCGTDIKTFYDSIERDRMIDVLKKRVKCEAAISLIRHALATPTVPKNARRSGYKSLKSEAGVPQGLAVSNILASIYMQEVDEAMNSLGVTYYRYVDDVLMYGDQELVHKAFRSLGGRLRRRGLSLHGVASGKTQIAPLHNSFGYLGYKFSWPMISVRESTIEKFLQSIASRFSDYLHNKSHRLAKFKYLTPDSLKSIFLLELNDRIAGAISAKRRYGWIAYFNQITDHSLLHRIDHTIACMFERLPDFGCVAPVGLKKLSRAYYEMKYSPHAGYVRNYDKISTTIEMFAFLNDRGRIDPEEAPLSDEQVKDRFDRYLHHTLASMHADEGVLY